MDDLYIENLVNVAPGFYANNRCLVRGATLTGQTATIEKFRLIGGNEVEATSYTYGCGRSAACAVNFQTVGDVEIYVDAERGHRFLCTQLLRVEGDGKSRSSSHTLRFFPACMVAENVFGDITLHTTTNTFRLNEADETCVRLFRGLDCDAKQEKDRLDGRIQIVNEDIVCRGEFAANSNPSMLVNETESLVFCRWGPFFAIYHFSSGDLQLYFPARQDRFSAEKRLEVFVDALTIDNSPTPGELTDKYRLCPCGASVVVATTNETERVVRSVRSKYSTLTVTCRPILVTDEFPWSNEKQARVGLHCTCKEGGAYLFNCSAEFLESLERERTTRVRSLRERIIHAIEEQLKEKWDRRL